jgi:hypothetical protein
VTSSGSATAVKGDGKRVEHNRDGEEDDRNTNIIIPPLSATLSDAKSHHDFRVDCLGDKTDNKS